MPRVSARVRGRVHIPTFWQSAARSVYVPFKRSGARSSGRVRTERSAAHSELRKTLISFLAAGAPFIRSNHSNDQTIYLIIEYPCRPYSLFLAVFIIVFSKAQFSPVCGREGFRLVPYLVGLGPTTYETYDHLLNPQVCKPFRTSRKIFLF